MNFIAIQIRTFTSSKHNRRYIHIQKPEQLGSYDPRFYQNIYSNGPI